MGWRTRAAMIRYNRAYYRKNKKLILKKQSAYRRSPRGKRITRRWDRQRWKKDGGASRRAYCRRWYAKNRAKVGDGTRTLNWNLKLEVIAAYGGKCSCCPEDRPEFLTIDHKKEDGKRHKITKRRIRACGVPFYRWLKRHKFPKRRFQLLCFNCNWGKHWFGICPHKLPREATMKMIKGGRWDKK